MTPLQLDPSAHAPWTRTIEGFGVEAESDLAATTYAGTMIRASIANGMTFFISISSPPLYDGSFSYCERLINWQGRERIVAKIESVVVLTEFQSTHNDSELAYLELVLQFL
jgi:hypothetical protein